jgi:hypothetical protein
VIILLDLSCCFHSAFMSISSAKQLWRVLHERECTLIVELATSVRVPLLDTFNSHGLRNEIHARKEERKARHAGKARWAFLFTSPHSLDPDPDSVTHIPGDGFGPKRLERSEASAIKTDLLFGELELVAERIAPHHLKKPCSVSLLDMMKQHLTGEAEVSALAHAVEMPVLRPHLEVLSQPALPDKLR